MLAEAVRRVRHEPPRTTLPATLDVELACGVPSAYVRDDREVFRLFRRVSTAPSLETLAGLREEIEDRFGPLPPETDRLVLHQTVRLSAGALGVERILPAEGGGLSVEAREGTPALDRLRAAGLEVRRLDARRGYVPPPPSVAGRPMATALEASLRALAERLAPRGPRGPGDARGGSPPPPRVSSPR
jgi:hypothetical protein